MKILLNPDNGAIIRNIWFKDEFFFADKEDQAFLPGMAVRVEDEFADYIVSTWDFVRELSVEEAKEFLGNKEMLKCDKCEFKTKVPVALSGHKRKHQKEAEIDELGIRVVGRKKKEEENADSRFEAWEEEDEKEGLIGEGLSDDSPRSSVIM